MFTCDVVKNKEQVVKYFYEKESEEWHKTVHKRGGSVKENIEETLSTINDESKMFLIKNNGVDAAFFVRYQNKNGELALEGFHVGEEFRYISFLLKFWKLVNEKMGKTYYTGLCSKNKNAIKHIIKQGFEYINSVEDNNNEFYIFKLKI